MQKPYVPISCNFYDELEAIATLKQSCTILYLDTKDKETTVQSRILNLYAKDKIEYMELENDLTIRLDQLISVNGKALKNYC